jgi:hypothetical protein
MAQYTALILAHTGEISAIQSGQGTWGRKECPPVFELVETDLTSEDMEWLKENGRYDLERKVFVHQDTEEVFEPAIDIIEVGEFDQDMTESNELAKTLNGGQAPVKPACEFLYPELPEDVNGRIHWFKLMYPFRRQTGVREFLRVARGGLFPDVRRAFLAIPTHQDILAVLPKSDREWMKWLTGA